MKINEIKMVKPSEFSKLMAAGVQYFDDMGERLTDADEIADLINSGKIVASIDSKNGNKKLVFLTDLKDIIRNFQTSLFKVCTTYGMEELLLKQVDA